MKTRFYYLLICSMLFFVSAAGQQQVEFKSIMLRIYDVEGAKISKGKLVNINKDGIVLKRGKKTSAIAISEIGKIKMKRALGHNKGDSARFLTFGLLGGAIYGAEKKSFTFEINGQKDEFLKFQQVIITVFR